MRPPTPGAITAVAGTAPGALNLLRGPESEGRVRQVAVPPSARRLRTLAAVDYEDGFVLETRNVDRLTGEEWARAGLEGAPAETQRALRVGWGTLGLGLGSSDDPHLVLGWEVRRSAPDFALLGGGSSGGMRAELLFKHHLGGLLFCTFVKLEGALARAVWAGVAPWHCHVVRSLLEEAGMRSAVETPPMPGDQPQ